VGTIDLMRFGVRRAIFLGSNKYGKDEFWELARRANPRADNYDLTKYSAVLSIRKLAEVLMLHNFLAYLNRQVNTKGELKDDDVCDVIALVLAFMLKTQRAQKLGKGDIVRCLTGRSPKDLLTKERKEDDGKRTAKTVRTVLDDELDLVPRPPPKKRRKKDETRTDVVRMPVAKKAKKQQTLTALPSFSEDSLLMDDIDDGDDLLAPNLVGHRQHQTRRPAQKHEFDLDEEDDDRGVILSNGSRHRTTAKHTNNTSSDYLFLGTYTMD
jgi:hypothetical protein